MGALNQRNYYQVQDLSSAEPIIKKMLEQKKKLQTIYQFIREEARWDSIGDFPVIVHIFHSAKKHRKIFTSNEVKKTFRQAKDGEFKKIHQDHLLIAQLYS